MQNLNHLEVARKSIKDMWGYNITNITSDPDSKDYYGHTFQVNNLNIIFRVAKVTPIKVGHFVTLYKRSSQGSIVPYDQDDPLDLVIISVNRGEHEGIFIFSTEVLFQQQILSRKNRGGKRAFRLYPPWERMLNAQALKTQKWQQDYFFFTRHGAS